MLYFLKITIACIAFVLLIAATKKGSISAYTQDTYQVKAQETQIGYELGEENEKPVFTMFIHSFQIDKKPITVAQFRKFIKLSRYITDAEKQKKGFYLDSLTQELRPLENAYWEYPEGVSKYKALDNQPIRQISWNDAKAYCNWVGKRLPSEFEWELILQKPEFYPLEEKKLRLWAWTDNFFRMYQETGYRKHRLNEMKTLKAGSIWDKKTQKNIQRPSLRIAHAPEISCLNFTFYTAQSISP